MKRTAVRRGASQSMFRRTANRTKSINIFRPMVVRGGFRL